MRITRLPGIHHDANIVLLHDENSAIIIDAGTSWYQQLQRERILGILGDVKPERILLTSRRYPFSGGAKYLSEQFGGIPIQIEADGIAPLETGDFFSTWANRLDSDMPATKAEEMSAGDVFSLGDSKIEIIDMSGHSPDGLGIYLEEKRMAIVGATIPRADRPARFDLPGGALVGLKEDIEHLLELNLKSIVPMQGPAIRGEEHVKDVLERHLEFFQNCIDNDGLPPKSWPRPASNAMWLTPRSAWPLEEKESA